MLLRLLAVAVALGSLPLQGQHQPITATGSPGQRAENFELQTQNLLLFAQYFGFSSTSQYLKFHDQYHHLLADPVSLPLLRVDEDPLYPLAIMAFSISGLLTSNERDQLVRWQAEREATLRHALSLSDAQGLRHFTDYRVYQQLQHGLNRRPVDASGLFINNLHIDCDQQCQANITAGAPVSMYFWAKAASLGLSDFDLFDVRYVGGARHGESEVWMGDPYVGAQKSSY